MSGASAGGRADAVDVGDAGDGEGLSLRLFRACTHAARSRARLDDPVSLGAWRICRGMEDEAVLQEIADDEVHSVD